NRCSNGNTFRRTYSATDACGNIHQRVQYIVYNDSIAPVLSFFHPLHPSVYDGDEITTQCYDNDYETYGALQIGANNIFVKGDCHYEMEYVADVVVSTDCKLDGYALFIT